MFDVNKLLEDAIKETENLNSGEKFVVRELFMGYKWNRILHKDRLLLGILFLNYINKTSSDLYVIEKTPSNQQRYTKIKDR